MSKQIIYRKFCPSCGRPLDVPIWRFCSPCGKTRYNKAAREKYKANPDIKERQKLYQKKYREAHREEYLKYKKEYNSKYK